MKSTGMPNTNIGATTEGPGPTPSGAVAANAGYAVAAITLDATATTTSDATGRRVRRAVRSGHALAQHKVLQVGRRKWATPSGFQSDIAARGCQRGPAWS